MGGDVGAPRQKVCPKKPSAGSKVYVALGHLRADTIGIQLLVTNPSRSAVAAVHYGGRIQVRELEYAQAAETLCGCFQNGLKVDWGPRLSHGVQKPRLTHTVCTRRGRHLVETETVTFQVTDDGYTRRSATGPFKARAAIRWRNMDGFEAQVAGRLLAR
jgi:hypothetical protein